jgi:hypothetical protein
MIDGATLYMLILAGIFVPLSMFAIFMTHRERLRDEAEDAEHAHHTPAE